MHGEVRQPRDKRPTSGSAEEPQELCDPVKSGSTVLPLSLSVTAASGKERVPIVTRLHHTDKSTPIGTTERYRLPNRVFKERV